jgi:hypothetical protein
VTVFPDRLNRLVVVLSTHNEIVSVSDAFSNCTPEDVYDKLTPPKPFLIFTFGFIIEDFSFGIDSQ